MDLKKLLNDPEIAVNSTLGKSLFSRLSQLKPQLSNDTTTIKRKEIVNVLRNVSTLISNGVSLSSALDTLREDDGFKKQRPVLDHLFMIVSSGGNLSDAMHRFPKAFPELMCFQVRVGERSGTLPGTLTRIVAQMEQSDNLRSFVIKKLTYPLILVVAGAGSVTFMLLQVIPTFQAMYEESGATLPFITQFLIDLSAMLQANIVFIVAALVGIIGTAVFLRRNPVARLRIDRQILQLPVVGSWFRSFAIMQFVETLSDLMTCGFTLVEAMPLASKAVGNRHISSELESIHGAIRQGEQFSTAIERKQKLFPSVVRRLVVVGERTGSLGKVTTEIKVHLRTEIEKTTSALLAMIEPVLTLNLAVIIGGILLAVYLPMFDMIGKTH